MVGLPVLGVAAILAFGGSVTAPLPSPVPVAPRVPSAPGMPNLVTLLLQVAAIVVTARLVGFLFRRIGQPQVVGEMVAGIMLGPSFLGWAAPALSQAIFPAASLGYLQALSQVGLLLFMFLVGL